MAKKKSKQEEIIEKEPPKPKRKTYKRIHINLWRTGLHKEEIGIYQNLKYEAQTRYFSKNFDIEGKIEIDHEDKWVLAFARKEWEETPKNEDKRLNVRLFTIMEEKIGERTGGNYMGGLELSMLHSIEQSYEVRRPAPVFFVHLPNLKALPRIVEARRFIGTRWAFPLLPETSEDKLQVVELKGKVGMGNDYKVYLGKTQIAEVNHQRVQKDVEINIFDENCANDKTFIMMITLFGCAMNFIDEIHKMIKKHLSEMRDSGTSDYKPPKPELDLYLNPRMVRK